MTKTMTHATKDRYIVRSKQQTKNMINKFIPVNPSEAKGTVKVPFEYPSEDYDDTNSA